MPSSAVTWPTMAAPDPLARPARAPSSEARERQLHPCAIGYVAAFHSVTQAGAMQVKGDSRMCQATILASCRRDSSKVSMGRLSWAASAAWPLPYWYRGDARAPSCGGIPKVRLLTGSGNIVQTFLLAVLGNGQSIGSTMLNTSCNWYLFVAAPSLALIFVAATQAAPLPQAAPQRAAAMEQRSSSWAALTPGQRTALAPLQADWGALAPERQSKWLEIARRWPALSTDEQQRLQRRMGRWARMTAEERSRARLHFQQVRRLDVDQRRAAWEAYQALSLQERRRLAARVQSSPGSRPAADKISPAAGPRSTRSAPTLRPIGPVLVQAAPGVSTVSIIQLAASPRQARIRQPDKLSMAAGIDHNTLLPKHGLSAADGGGISTVE